MNDEEPMAESEESNAALPVSWSVDLPVFQGPLDLLLHLTRVNEVEITDIPISLICDQFQEYLRLMEELNLDIAGEYIYEAAQLIHLKSRMLLPRKTDADGEPVEDPREELVRRLIEYRKIKEAAQSLAETHAVRRGIWTRRVKPSQLGLVDEETVELGEVSLHSLLGALKKVLDRYDREHPDALHLEREVFSVRDQFDRLLSILDAGRPFDLIDDLRQLSSRGEVVAAFLSVLELARLHLVRLHQTDQGEVLLYRTTRVPTEEELEAISR
jgi:segregation and condensation protein A